MRIPFLLMLAIVLLTSFSFSTFANAINDDKQTYQQCAACHGDKGQGSEALNAPALAGQFNWYIARQVEHFKLLLRGDHADDSAGQQMAVIAKSISTEADLSALSSYIESLSINTINTNNAGKTQAKGISVNDPQYSKHKNGSNYYQAKCGACHGGNAQGNKSFNAPKLSLLSASYLNKQMANFSTGLRGTHQKDKFGRQMAMMAKTTSGEELADIIFFITQQNNSEIK